MTDRETTFELAVCYSYPYDNNFNLSHIFQKIGKWAVYFKNVYKFCVV